MNLTVKRCLLGLVAWATLFGIARAQFQEPAGTVQLGSPNLNGGPVFPPGPTQVSDYGSQPVPRGTGTIYGMTQVDRLFAPRGNIDSRGGGLYGYQAGYSNIGVFAPYKLEEDAIVFVHGMGLITYDGRGGATVGTGWRYWMENIDRIVGLSAWFDFDNGHAQPFQQVGLSFESLGRYVDYRVNGYIPISNPEHVLYSSLTQNAFLNGNLISLIRNNTTEQSYTGFDAEIGGPTPILGRYGLNAYIGGYFFTGNGSQGGDFTGVSGRILSQINEDVSFGVQVTNDHLFGLNTQFQVFANLPDGKPSRWFRNPRVHDRLVQNVFRQNRVMARTSSFQTSDAAIDPTTHRPYFVANINPNLGTAGNGTSSSPFGSISQYEMASLAQRQRYDIILVQPRTDSKSTNLDTYTAGVASTLQLFNGQSLWSTSIQHTITPENIPGLVLNMPGFTGGSAPKLFNSNGADVITLVGGNTRNMEVSGFDITGSATGNGIYGNNNLGVNLNNNNIHGGLNGVQLTNLSGSIVAGLKDTGTEFKLIDNNIHDNVGNGVQVTNSGTNPGVKKLDVVVQGNTFNSNGHDGLQFVAQAGGTIGGIIGGPSTAAVNPLANTFEANTFNGLDLIANGGTLNFQSPAVATSSTSSTTTSTNKSFFGVANNAFGIYDNIFTTNKLDGLHIDMTNNSLGNFLIVNNSFGVASTLTSGNQQYGIGLLSDSGVANLTIGGNLITNSDGTTSNPGNVFNYNAVSAINLAVSGTGTLNYDIGNNTITNGANKTVAAPHDSFTFDFNGTSGTDPFSITNTSDPGVLISSVTWNLTGTPATIAPTTVSVAVNPVVLQPISDTLLTSLNGIPVTAGSVPLLISATNGRANNANSGLAAGSQIIPMGFTNFLPSDVFKATAEFQQSAGSSALTSAATNNSTLTVNFSNGLSTTNKVALVSPTGIEVKASGDVFGSTTPGFGSGVDGIHVSASGTSNMGTSNIHDNNVTGYGGYGIHVETSGSASAPNVVLLNNTVSSNGTGVDGTGTSVFSGGGVLISRNDSSSLNAYLANNIISQNFNDGLVLSSNGTATGDLSVYTTNNQFTNNAGSGLKTSTSGAGILNYTSNGDTFNGNGSGSGKNLNATGGDNISINVSGTSVENVTLTNVVSNGTSGSGLSSGGLATGSGLSATTNYASTLNLLIETSQFNNNKVYGIVLNSMGTSLMHASIYNTEMNNNGNDGILFVRMGASLVRGNITDSSMSGNNVNGLQFSGFGSDPQDPNQQFSNTPNRINLLRDTLNNNGLNGVGQGARIDLLGDSELVLNATATTFDNNAQNGIRINIAPGAQFGYLLGNERSTFDNVEINGNGSNGLFLTSQISDVDPNSNNAFLPFDAPSLTFMQISANTGNTTINDNGYGVNATGLSGVLLQYLGGNHDVLIEGDVLHSTPLYTTAIQHNKVDGIHSEAGIEADTTLSLNRVLVGGPLAANANGGDGVDFEVQASLTIVDGASVVTRNFNGAGIGTLNVTDSIIQGNLGNGINLIGDDLNANNRTANAGAVPGLLNANITNSSITDNKLSGINILLEGEMGDFRQGGSVGQLSTFVIDNNKILSNGQFGVKMEQNAAFQLDTELRVDFSSPAQTTPPTPFNHLLYQGFFGSPGTNTGDQTDIRAGIFLSNYMDLQTVNNASLTFTNNIVQFNGKAGDLRAADGVYIRVGTEAYLAADIRNNTITGNVANDFHVESFTQYNPLTGVSQEPTQSVGKNAPPGINSVFLDKTAQMDLRFTGNVLNTVNIQDPLVNTTVINNVFIALQGNSTPNGAVVGANNANNSDPLKNNDLFGAAGFANPTPRLVQLFQVDDAFNLDSNNVVRQNGINQGLQNAFFNASWHLRNGADPLFPNPAFPQDFTVSPGNPFLP